MNKEKMLQRVEKYLEDNKNGAAYGLYIVKRRVFADDPDDAVYIGDALGPMGPGRYTTLERFYASLKHEEK